MKPSSKADQIKMRLMYKAEPGSEEDNSDLGSLERNSDSDSEEDGWGTERNYWERRDESDSESEEDESNSESEEDESNSESEAIESDPKELDESATKDNEISSVPNLPDTILKTLQNLKAPSTFACSGVCSPLPIPGLYLPSHGVVSLPLTICDAQNIIAAASQSPFGKGEKTLVDTTVRKSWELNPNQFSLKNPEWNGAIETILNNVCFGLGIKQGTGSVSAKLHKLLLYEPGAFFKPHKDSEKAPGMFGTLVVCLPSMHEGGKLIMTQHQQKYEFETATSSSFNYSYAAWYADITHEVQPITSGYRLMLVYNLIRETDFKIPSYDLTRGHAQELMRLLKIYNSMLEEGYSKLPPLLLHRLKHQYTPANLQLKLLKPQDFARVQTLSQISTELGFNIYLATLELALNTCDEGMIDEVEFYGLKNVVKLDGKLFLESFDFGYGKLPVGSLINPVPLKQKKKGKAVKEKHEGPTGNEGSPATYWYHDTVVVLLPPSKQLDFIFKYSYTGNIVEPLFCSLMQEFTKDPAQKLKLEQLCELALKQKYSYIYGFKGRTSEVPFFKQALATALDVGRWDLLGEACRSRGDEILFEKVDMLCSLAAKDGVTAIHDGLVKCVQGLSSVAKMVEFSKLFSECYENIVKESASVGKLNLQKWLEEVVFTAVSKSALTETDAIFLGQICKTINWSLFESKTLPAVLKAKTMVRIAFVDEFMSTFEQKLDNEQQSFVTKIICDVWNEFVFKYYYGNKNELLHIFKTSVTVVPSECVETTIIPAILKAIPKATKSKDVYGSLMWSNEVQGFLQLVQLIIKNELVGFNLSKNDAAPPSSHKRLVQALLAKFLMESVKPKPQAPTDWSVPAESCNCSKCSDLNRFLQDPFQQKLYVPYDKSHCRFDRWRDALYTPQKHSFYDVQTIRRHDDKFWRIIKHQRKYANSKREWKQETEAAKRTLSKLESDESVKGKLKAYLQPYYEIIINAAVEKLPNIQSWATTQLSPESNRIEAPNQAAPKREGDNIDLPAKRSR